MQLQQCCLHINNLHFDSRYIDNLHALQKHVKDIFDKQQTADLLFVFLYVLTVPSSSSLQHVHHRPSAGVTGPSTKPDQEVS